MTPANAPEIRAPKPGHPAELQALAALLTELGYPTDAAQAVRRLRQLEPLVAARQAVVLVATRGDLVVGVATVHLYATIHVDAPRAQLTALVVAERARGRGIGRALVEAASEWAAGAGSERLTVTTALHRAGAHAFYERLGFEHTGRRYARTLATARELPSA